MDKLITVRNRDNGSVGYAVPDLSVVRNFQPKEVKKISKEELIKLSYMPGGIQIIRDCLIVNDEELLEELLNEKPEPEYFYTEKDIEKLLKEGTLNQLLDCLDFAPLGVKELLKEVAVKIKLNDIDKRNAITQKLNFNISKAIEINEESNKVEEEDNSKKRRSNPISKEKEVTPKRRSSLPKYNVVSE